MSRSSRSVPAGTRYRHPLGWFDVAVPPGWVADDESDPVRFIGPGSEAVAVISVAKTSGVALPAARTRFLKRKLAGLVTVKKLATEEGERDGLSWARTKELLGKALPWYKRLFRRPAPETVLVTACFTRGAVLALLTCEIEPDKLERHELMIDAMVGSLRLAASPAPAPPEFVERFLSLARERFPDRTLAVGDERLSIKVDGAELSLELPYRTTVRDADVGDAAFEAIFRYLGSNPIPLSGSETFADVEARILPAIKPRSWVRSTDAKLTKRHRLLWMPFPNDTAVVFVVDYDAAMRFVSKDESERWETPPKHMLRIARENLQRRNEDPPEHLLMTQEGEPHAFALAVGDGYDAARLLLPGLRDRLVEHFGDDFAVAIPNRDFLIAFRTDKQGVLKQMRELIGRDSSNRPYPITDALFQFTDSGIEPLEL